MKNNFLILTDLSAKWDFCQNHVIEYTFQYFLTGQKEDEFTMILINYLKFDRISA